MSAERLLTVTSLSCDMFPSSFHRRMRPQRLIPMLAIAVWIGLGSAIAVHAYFFPRSHTVYDIYSLAARKWWAGQDLYAPIVKEWWEESGVRGGTTDYYRYCPLFAVAVTPFALLPDCLGNPLWKVFCGAFFVTGLAVAARRLFPVTLNGSRLAVFFLLVSLVALQSLYIGQANLIVIGAVLLGLSAGADERWNRAAMWLALATLVKGYPLGIGLLVAALYPGRFLGRYLVALAAGLLLPFLAQRPSVVINQTVSWWQHLQDSTILMRERLRSMDKLLEVCRCAVSPSAFAWMGLAAGLVCWGLCLFRSRQTTDIRTRLTWTLQLFSIWVVLFGPATEACTYVVVAPAVAWAIMEAFQLSRSWMSRALLILSLHMMGPMVTDMYGPIVRAFANGCALQPLGAVIFLAVLAAETFPRRQPIAPLALPT
jgi:hypothetical protein